MHRAAAPYEWSCDTLPGGIKLSLCYNRRGTQHSARYRGDILSPSPRARRHSATFFYAVSIFLRRAVVELHLETRELYIGESGAGFQTWRFMVLVLHGFAQSILHKLLLPSSSV